MGKISFGTVIIYDDTVSTEPGETINGISSVELSNVSAASMSVTSKSLSGVSTYQLSPTTY